MTCMTDFPSKVPDAAPNSTDSSPLYTRLATLVDRLDRGFLVGTDVIPWSCPVPFFGDFSTPRVATLGINPSSREFTDKNGNELKGIYRRFHTLYSLGIGCWAETDARHLGLILDACRLYFSGNPYNAWFKKLDLVISQAKASYYGPFSTACHLDLVPYATAHKWTDLSEKQRSLLLEAGGENLGLFLRDSPVRILILNGTSVVKRFQSIAGSSLEAQEVPAWSLSRQSKRNVAGVAYKGMVDKLSGIKLGHDLMVLGFNHNLQSSFGVSMEVIGAIGNWVAQSAQEVRW